MDGPLHTIEAHAYLTLDHSAGAQARARDRGAAGEGDAAGRGERAEDGRASQEDQPGGGGAGYF